MDTNTTARAPRQRERLACDPEPKTSDASPANPGCALSSDDLVAEHNKGSLPSQSSFDKLTGSLGVPPLALSFERNGCCNPLLQNTIVQCGRHFEFARDANFEDGAQAAFTLLAFGICGDPVDIVAFRPKPYVHLCLLGRVTAVGEDQVLQPHLSRGLRVHRTILGYLAHRRRGIVIINHARAALLLHGVRIIPEDDNHRDELRRALVAGPVVLEPGED